MTTGNLQETLTKQLPLQEGRAKPRPRRNQLLRQARKERRLSQTELAECIGVTNETISRWENGGNEPQSPLLRKLCEVLEKTPEALGYPLEEEVTHPSPTETVSIREATPPPPPSRRRRFSLIIGAISVIVVAGILFGVFIFLGIPRPLPCGGAFSDEFHGHLNSGWSWIDPSGSATERVAPQGPLSISAPRDSDIYLSHQNFSAPRLLQPINGDFLLDTFVSFSASTNYQGAGILLWQDQTTFLRLELAHGLSRESGVDFQDASGHFSHLDQHPTTTSSIELRVQKQGERFTAGFRVPGQNWQSAGETDLHFEKLQVGLDVIADYSAPQTTANFDYFTVSCT